MLRRFAVQNVIFASDRLFAFLPSEGIKAKSKIRKAERISEFFPKNTASADAFSAVTGKRCVSLESLFFIIPQKRLRDEKSTVCYKKSPPR